LTEINEPAKPGNQLIQGIIMKRFIISLAAIALLTGGTIANAKGKVVHRVSVGGADVCEALGLPTGCDANFSLVAIQKADGSVKGQWQDTFPGGGEGIHVAIDCLNVVGNQAVIGGVITHGTLGGVDLTGLGAVTKVSDNGTSANDVMDQISFSWFPVDADAPCDAFDFDFFPPEALYHGQVKVK
jgi:hypothetical protein